MTSEIGYPSIGEADCPPIQPAGIAQFKPRDPVTPSVIALTGYGLSVTVYCGHLILRDGIGRRRRERRLSRAQRVVDRIVIIGQTGQISLEAVRWCADTGVTLIQIDTLGRVGLLGTTIGRDDARLRRAQALATVNGAAIEAGRYLIGEKLRGQHDVLRKHGLAELQGLAPFIELVESATTLAEMTAAESGGAIRYFQAWTDRVIPKFARQYVNRVPEHWLRFRIRGSLIHPSPGARDAADPVNALLNYCYTLAETECTIALRTLGLDPGLGIVHVDRPNRDSLALDLIEPIRPLVDDLVLELLLRRAFTTADFNEHRDGGCRINPHLAAELSGHLSDLRPHVAKHAEALGKLLVAGANVKTSIGTQLTGSAWLAANGIGMTEPITAWSAIPRTCETCGTEMTARHRKLCTPCWKHRRSELAKANAVALNARLAELKAQGIDPRASTQARNRRSAANRASNRARYAWQPSPEEAALTKDWYLREVQPHLAGLTRRAIQDALGVSDTAATKIRSGRLCPHRRHWTKLRDLVEAQRSSPIV